MPEFTLAHPSTTNQYMHLGQVKVCSPDGKSCLLKTLQQVKEAVDGVELNENTTVKGLGFALLWHLHKTCVHPKLIALLDADVDTKSCPTIDAVPKLSLITI